MADARKSDFGQVITVTITDSAGTAIDVGDALTRLLVFTSPVTGTVTSKAASFSTDGSDGKIKWTVTSGFFNEVGNWQVQGRVGDGSTFQYSTKVGLIPIDRILE